MKFLAPPPPQKKREEKHCINHNKIINKIMVLDESTSISSDTGPALMSSSTDIKILKKKHVQKYEIL